MTAAAQETDDSPATRENLAELFRQAETRREDFLIGAESEKIGVHAETGAPLAYAGDFSVARLFSGLVSEHGWEPFGEVEGGPILGLKRAGASVTLEPGAQFELSGAPLPDLHAVAEEQTQHYAELEPITREMGLAWLMTGFHPLAKLSDLPWVPKQRYPIMRDYLPAQGSGALDMMQRTATVQANFDWSSEADGMRKMRVALRLSPLVHAMFANAPFLEGRATELLSQRGNVWLHMDPSRSGLIAPLWDAVEPGYQQYVDWALDAGMFLFRRNGRLLRNTGQSFAEFMRDGFAGERATIGDFRLHLTTLFPEVRLKNTLEVRSCDNLPPELALSAIALWTGVLYDDAALGQAESLTAACTFEGYRALRPELIRNGLATTLWGRVGWEWAESLLDIARGGLERRGRRDAAGADERIYLAPSVELVQRRAHPADDALRRFSASGSILDATRLRSD